MKEYIYNVPIINDNYAIAHAVLTCGMDYHSGVSVVYKTRETNRPLYLTWCQLGKIVSDANAIALNRRAKQEKQIHLPVMVDQ